MLNTPLLQAVRGFHIYHRVWTPWLGQYLHREREDGNTEDRFAAAVVKKGVGDTNARTTVGHLHVPREVSQVYGTFWDIEWEVTGRRQHSPLVQGGLEIVFMWKEEINNQGERSVGEKNSSGAKLH